VPSTVGESPAHPGEDGECLRTVRKHDDNDKPRAAELQDVAEAAKVHQAAISPIAIRMTWPALPITSVGRFSPLGPRGIRHPLLAKQIPFG